MRAGLGHPDCALAGRDAVQVSLRPDAHGGGDRLVELLAHLDGPLHLLDVLVVLREFIIYYASHFSHGNWTSVDQKSSHELDITGQSWQ